MKKRIKLSDTYGTINVGGTEFLFDIEDLPIIQGRNWYKDKSGYLVSFYYFNGRKVFIGFHRIIMNAKHLQVVDHINRKRFDNRKSNLRICTRAENDRNRSLYKSNTSGVAGVRFDKTRNKWAAMISFNGKKIFLGRFVNKEDAIRARKEKEIELFGAFAPSA